MKRKRLGQHYLVDSEAVERIVDAAKIRPSEKVLEIGTGRGELTGRLAHLCTAFLGYEIDEENYEAAVETVRGTGAKLVLGDAFAQAPEFDVLVTSLPYSESATFVRWLSSRRFSRAIAVLQKDFLEKITAPSGARGYRGVSAVAQMAFNIKMLAKVRRDAFEPPPRVDSVIAEFSPRRLLSKDEVASVIRLFSLRRRRVDSALAELGFDRKKSYGERRVFSLTPAEVEEICRPRSRP